MRELRGLRVVITGGSGFIGLNLTLLLLAMGADVANIDLVPPDRQDLLTYWIRGDITQNEELTSMLRDLRPDCLVHLAARTDTDSDAVDEYAVNFVGTRSVLNALVGTGCGHVVITSTQFVIGPGMPFDDLRKYSPHTSYGESKVRMEQDVEATPPSFPWTIVRPTIVWGPGHVRYAAQFWSVLARGLYLHPAVGEPVRSYGYVGTVCQQIAAILREPERHSHQIYYLGDYPMPQSAWVDAFANALTGRAARRTPNALLRAIGVLGDSALRLNLKAPLTSARYKSMITEYRTPMGRTFSALGFKPTVSLERGILETVDWLRLGLSPDAASWSPPRPDWTASIGQEEC